MLLSRCRMLEQMVDITPTIPIQVKTLGTQVFAILVHAWSFDLTSLKPEYSQLMSMQYPIHSTICKVPRPVASIILPAPPRIYRIGSFRITSWILDGGRLLSPCSKYISA